MERYEVNEEGLTQAVNDDGSISKGAELTECLNCGADIRFNTRPGRRPDFCDMRCEEAFYGDDFDD